MASVELIHLHKRFDHFVALDDLNLTVNDGEFLVLLGPSGCGKSTTMRLVAGLEEPSSGDIHINGKRVNDLPARKRDLAMVFQNYALYPHMTVGENIGYPLRLQKVARDQRQIRVNEAAAMVELETLLTRKPAELSGGQRQRVALARAIVRRPQIFLMDEPLSNLDAKLRTVMRTELGHLQKTLDTTTLYVTHDQVEAMTLADRIVVMNQARIQQIGTPSEIYTYPDNTFVAGFMGSPPMNLIDGCLSNGVFHHSHGTLNVSNDADGPVILGIRPEHIQVTDGSGDVLQGNVYASELLGDSVILNVRCGETSIYIKVGADDGMPINTAVQLSCNTHRISLFDKKTGRRLPDPGR